MPFPKNHRAMKRHKFLISGYYGFGNAGDEAILGSIVHALRSTFDDPDICVFSDNPDLTAQQLGVRSVNRKSPLAMGREMLGASVLLSGGGGLLQDSTGITTIRYYLGVVRMARLLRVPVMFYAQGMGPVRTQAGRSMVTRIANTVQLITVRDDESRVLLDELKVTRPPVRVTADPVLAFEPAPSERIAAIWREEGLPDDKPVMALSVRPWAEHAGFEQAFVRVGAHLAETGVHVLVVPFQDSQDREICRRVAAGIGAGASCLSRAYLAPELMGILGRCAATFGMRLHALIFAAAQGVPMAGVAYDPKVAQFLRRVQAPCLPLESLCEDSLRISVLSLLRDRDEHRQRLQGLVPALRSAALSNVALLDDLLAGKSLQV